MAKVIRQDKYQYFFYRALTISLTILLLSETVAANTNVRIAQQPPAASPSGLNSQGQQLLNEAQQLLRQGSKQSQTNALAKYEQALAIGQKIGDRALVALALQGIGLVYYQKSDNPKALEYYNQALAVVRDFKNPIAKQSFSLLWLESTQIWARSKKLFNTTTKL